LIEGVPEPDDGRDPEPDVGNTVSTTFWTEGSLIDPPPLGELDPEGELDPDEGLDEPEGSVVFGTLTLGVLTGGVWTLGVVTDGVETLGVLTFVLGT
jgi:hypothetical protein